MQLLSSLFANKELINRTEQVLIVAFLIVMAFGMYLIIYYNILRFKGIINSTYKITGEVFERALSNTKNEMKREQIKYCKTLYLVFLSSLIPLLALLFIFYVWIDPA